jgi:hypothetical protein
VSQSQRKTVVDYIDRQAEHHAKWSFEQEFVTLLKKSGIPYDPRLYLASFLCRPYGTRIYYAAFSALKGWAKLFRPAPRDSRVVAPTPDPHQQFEDSPSLEFLDVQASPLPRDLACFRDTARIARRTSPALRDETA